MKYLLPALLFSVAFASGFTCSKEAPKEESAPAATEEQAPAADAAAPTEEPAPAAPTE